MEKVNFVKTRKDAQWGVQLSDGRIIEILNKEGVLVLRFDTPINLETGEIIESAKECPEGFVTLNDILSEKKGKRVFCYDEFDVDLGFIRTMSDNRINRIIRNFKRNGFNVTKEAIMHNWNAWNWDMKSGYRDEKNGYHLFTPCGHNHFSLRATTLEKCCKEWQKTYEC